ncbi:nucleotide exchange factor GrpE [Candidatus Nomurabacteria bacterium]|uniref:Protein GrpE n=1 Tax=candidate division WWE3 bacterium TaxID=2053526 RepID=A0A955DZQ3_UNCKA|nr:nucleotide exchange factor GrpE [candidate division WWE3 bacterium]MCB9823816.1 nucleotide exchange factor GrpE [Candidatus Nomurabacteria bacterium]MCB9826778.1 nucleotide exchange factor GrpE [Candidatus Nomurabacteria bacterium]MCB9827611.1 nucleotide exchange factor GrpE [Candidatus Nomurabacteria bacterium]HXK52601.1 nucleotide exchange factor GrpE [bacterium]
MTSKKSTTKVVEELQKKIEEYEENWKRALADYKNLQKRVEEERAEIFGYANKNLIQRFIPVLDNLETMAKHFEDQGIKLILKQLIQILEEEGVAEIESDKKTFDPHEMEAVEHVETGGDLDNKVIETTQKGYKMGNKVIRPARVKVGKTKGEK